MDELIPVTLGTVLGAAIWSSTKGRARVTLSILAVVVYGVTATIVSGEYIQSWAYFLLDLGEAALGVALGSLIARAVIDSRGVGRRNVAPSNAPTG